MPCRMAPPVQEGPSCTGGCKTAVQGSRVRLKAASWAQGSRSRTARAAPAMSQVARRDQRPRPRPRHIMVCTKFLKNTENICMALRKDD